ncbi:MAG: DUF4954 family protein, partial [Candidatus Marinimicrobia bacterium]|nr:DUF4954 family protein [Candidatus Neomarinimicrobiota bacterium]
MRNLNQEEIKQLEMQNCIADDWSKIQVDEEFDIKYVNNVRFHGNIRIGKLNSTVKYSEGIEKHSIIRNADIFNSEIGNNVYISDVRLLSNYKIGDQTIIENVGQLSVEGESTFGNGYELEILNEGGGRELKMFDTLTSQIAYLLVLYRHDTKLTNSIEKMVDEFVENVKSNIGTIGENSKILNTKKITNVKVGSSAIISNAMELFNGTIVSNAEASVIVGNGVIAKNFIINSGTKIDDNVIIDGCFIGQSVKLGRQYSAENSAFFANCEGYHGEACSIFAGPYTVTHHKSTLLIAGLFSFFNAGSGTNQSNHMYKLGPLHQGIVERGAKTGSFSYMLWPSRVGAFTAVIGKHYSNFDTTDFPFSYINEVDGKSILTPAMNLLSVGTTRDSEKWPSRDKRTDPNKLDLINFELFNPYTIGKVLNGHNKLLEFVEKTDKKRDHVNYNGVKIPRLLLKTTAKYYKLAIDIFIGQSVMKKLDKVNLQNFEEVKKLFNKDGNLNSWFDMSGLLISERSSKKLQTKIKNNEIQNIDKLSNEFVKIFNNYSDEEWLWTLGLIKKYLEIDPENITAEDLVNIIQKWKKSSLKLNKMVGMDATKEFNVITKIGFGIDGSDEGRDADFEAVRGTYEDNKFVKQLLEKKPKIEAEAEK